MSRLRGLGSGVLEFQGASEFRTLSFGFGPVHVQSGGLKSWNGEC